MSYPFASTRPDRNNRPLSHYEQVEKALFCISPDLPLDDWWRIGSALKDDGFDFELFDRWSSTGESYKPKECQSWWKSFKTGKIHIATLFWYANQNGYRPEKNESFTAANAPIFQKVTQKTTKSTAAKKLALSWKNKRFNSLLDLYHSVEANVQAIYQHGYLIRKFPLDSERLILAQTLADSGLKVSSDKNGSFLLVPFSHHAKTGIIGFQKIYADKFTDYNDSERDKDFCFFYETEDKTYWKGSYFIIGKLIDVAAIGEGLATIGSCHLATHQAAIMAHSAANLRYVAKAFHAKKIRDFIFYADNDLKPGKKNTGKEAAINAARAIYTDAENIKVCYPDYEQQKLDFNDLHILLGIDSVQSQILTNQLDWRTKKQKLEDCVKSQNYNFISVEEAVSQLQAAIDQSFLQAENYKAEKIENESADLPDPIVIKAPAGLGKSTSCLEKIAACQGRLKIGYYVPTHDLAEELADKIKSLYPDLSVHVFKGRGYLDAENTPLCKRIEEATELFKQGYSCYQTLCYKKIKDKEFKCPFFDDCHYVMQQSIHADITIYPHAYLTKQKSTVDCRKHHLAIIDERCYSEFIVNKKLDFIELAKTTYPSFTFKGNEYSLDDVAMADVINPIRNALEQQKPIYEILQAELGENLVNTVTAAYQSLNDYISAAQEKFEKSINPTIAIPKLTPLPLNYLTLFNHLRKELAANAERSISSITRFSETTLIVNYRRNLSRLDNTPLLVIDADANPVIADKLFPNHEFVEINVKRKCKVTQIYSSTMAKMRFSGREDKTQEQKAAAQLKEKTLKVIHHLANQHRDVLIVTYKQLEEELIQSLPSNCKTLHFGNLRGLDGYKDFDACIVIGRNQPSLQAVSEQARAFYFEDIENLSLETTLELSEAKFTDVRPQAFLTQIRDCETLQAIDRLRLIHATEEKHIYLISNLPLEDLKVDSENYQTIHFNDLLVPSRLDKVKENYQQIGVMPLSPSYLFDRHPEIFTSLALAKKEVASHYQENVITYRLEHSRGGLPLNAAIWQNLTDHEIEYRLEILHGKKCELVKEKIPIPPPIPKPKEIVPIPPEQQETVPIPKKEDIPIKGNSPNIKKTVLKIEIKKGRPQMKFLLHHNKGGGIVLGNEGETVEEVLSHLSQRYQENLKEVIYENHIIYSNLT